MGESLSLLGQIKEQFQCEPVDVRTFSPLTLAFLGDCVFDLIIRTVVVERGNRAANGLHKTKSAIVKAQSQAQMIEAILPELTDEEQSVYRRGRNAKSYTTAKNASVGDYRKATGFEALIGYLYLQDRMERVFELVKKGLAAIGTEI
ncbi:MAG: ribonuclease III [Lachnospiraceae bacterium]|nr:ribonuclease III [Lachnospiraceae bacterium]